MARRRPRRAGTAIVIMNDSPIGRLHIEDVDVPEFLHTGDVVALD